MTNSTLQAYVPSHVVERVKQIARDTGTTSSRIVLEAVLMWLDHQEKQQTQHATLPRTWLDNLEEGEHA